jgi:hypothetical protein
MICFCMPVYTCSPCRGGIADHTNKAITYSSSLHASRLSSAHHFLALSFLGVPWLIASQGSIVAYDICKQGVQRYRSLSPCQRAGRGACACACNVCMVCVCGCVRREKWPGHV